MARLKPLSQRYRMQVAERLGSFIAPRTELFESGQTPGLELRENFPLWVLPDNAQLATHRDLAESLISTGSQILLVYRGDTAVGFAVAHPESVARPVVDAYSESDEMQTLSGEIAAVDAADIPDHFEARIVDERARHIGAIILVSDQPVPSLVRLFRVPPGQDRLQVGRFYDSREFIESLLELPETTGLTLDDIE